MSQRDLRDLITDAEIKSDVIELLAKFFQESFEQDPLSSSEWLDENQTSTDLFVDLVVALRRRAA